MKLSFVCRLPARQQQASLLPCQQINVQGQRLRMSDKPLHEVLQQAPDDDPWSDRDLHLLDEALAVVEVHRSSDIEPAGFRLSSPDHLVWLGTAQDDLKGLQEETRAQIEKKVRAFITTGHGDVRKVRKRKARTSTFALRVGRWRIAFLYRSGSVQVLRVLPRDRAYS